MNDFQQWSMRHPQAAAELWRILEPPVTGAATGTSEAALQAELRLTSANLGYSLWRNNSGACMDDRGRLIRYGLANDSKRLNEVFKSSDLIGIGPHGRFVAVEVKAPGWRGPRDAHEKAQGNFLAKVASMGGIAGFVTSVEQYEEMVR